MRLIASILAVSLFLSSCEGDDPAASGKGRVELVFKGTYGNAPMITGETYDYFGRGTIFLSKMEFYLSHIQMRNPSDSALLTDVEYILMSEGQTDSAKAVKGVTLVFDQVPAGSYQSLEFNLGLTREQNKTQPADYSATHPLGEGTRYWAGWNSYIYSKTEGVLVAGANHYNFTYHSGFDNAVRFVKLPGAFEVRSGETRKL
ncbi:MAG TPA: MbnP family protein, partial [Saprospiraceae bacterium]|nr:MbnP family protein [Saprospiraceae bacterium]